MIRDKTIFITGGAGFISTALIREIVDNNQVIAYDNFRRDSLSSSPYADHANLKIVKGDVLDVEALNDAIGCPDIVVHAAGIAGIDTVIKNPVETMQVNMLGTSNVLEAAHRAGVKGRFVDFSTSEIFGSMAYKSAEDDNAVSGSAGEARWTYAVSKLAGEHLAKAYHSHYGLPVVTLRPFNVYGPGQTGEGAIHAFIVRALADQEITIHGDGSQIRAWCFVDDFIRCLLKCMTDPRAVGEIFNVGNARAIITILGLAQTVCRVLGSESKISFGPALSADIELRIPSVSKARDLLGFNATVELEDGIRRTALWYSKTGK